MGAASGPCVGETASVSGGVFGVSIGGGRSVIDKECTRRETARVLFLLGDRETALRLMMAAPIVAEIAAPVPAPSVASPTASATTIAAASSTPTRGPSVASPRACPVVLPTPDERRIYGCE
jgi:hypothetical protein